MCWYCTTYTCFSSVIPVSILIATIQDKRDNSVHYSLRNWADYIRKGMQDGPREHLQGASWQGQVTDRVTEIDPPEPHYIDENNAERTQGAMVLCMVHDMETAMLLTKHYRDGWNIPNARKARNRFWRFL